jgi:hypothetical protein
VPAKIIFELIDGRMIAGVKGQFYNVLARILDHQRYIIVWTKK